MSKDKYLENMMYIDKNAVTILSRFITEYEKLETKRDIFANKAWTLYCDSIQQYCKDIIKGANSSPKLK